MEIMNHVLANSRLKKGFKFADNAKTATDEKKAENLFDSAYKAYASIIENNVAVQKALYWWGLALYDQAQTKTGQEAEKLYQMACEKFSIALITDPTNSRVANDWGVALMQQARITKAAPENALYAQAYEKFLLAEQLQPGIASYNLACIHSLRKQYDDCKNHLETARNLGTIPAMEELREDADLGNVKNLSWFEELFQDPSETVETVETNKVNATSETPQASEPPDTVETVEASKANPTSETPQASEPPETAEASKTT